MSVTCERDTGGGRLSQPVFVRTGRSTLPPVNEPQTPAPAAASSSSPRASRSLVELLDGLSDARLIALSAAVLFVLSAWPLLLVPLPPFQDLPNHVATAHIIAHPDLYPEFGFNGLFKSNALLTLWFCAFGRFGLFGAARAFAALVLAATAVALPVFVHRFAGRRAVPVAMLCGWPLVHSYSVSMGFLNFSFGVALSLILATVVDRQRERPTAARALGIGAFSVVLWYAHPFPLGVVGILVAAHAVTRPTQRERIAASLTLLLPLVPAGILSLVTAQHHLVKAENSTAAHASLFYLNPWELLEHLWLDVSGALTWWGAGTILPAVLLPFLAWRGRRLAVPFFSWPALIGIFAVYLALPQMYSNWNYLNTRMVPFLWAGFLLRVPPRLPRAWAIGLALAALSFSVALGVDYRRLDHDRALFTAGIDAVPERATLLPLEFSRTRTGKFTASLTHAWGYYTVAKDTSAPLVFGVERSYPITYREFPPGDMIPPALDRFAENYRSASYTCWYLKLRRDSPFCPMVLREVWKGFWSQAEPRFSHLLIWALPVEVRPLIPASYHRVFVSGDLEIFARAASPN
jgi:hypothetical protein